MPQPSSDIPCDVALEAKSKADLAHAAVVAHEDLCAERYTAIRQDIVDLKWWLKTGLVGIITALATIAWGLARHQ